VTERAPAVLVQATLRRSDHVALILHSTRPQQQFPVGTARGVRESGGHGQQVARRHGERAVQLRETHVIADAQAHAEAFGVEGHRLPAGIEHRAFIVPLPAVVVVEQVHLVVARGQGPVGREDMATVEHPPRRSSPQRQRAADDPYPVLACRAGERGLDRTVAQGFRNTDLVAIAVPHQAKILGQGHETRTGVGRLGDQRAGPLEISVHIGRGHHLQCGNQHERLPGCRLRGAYAQA